MTQDNIFAFDHLRQVEKLIESVGSIDECKRLGFVHVDEQGVQSLSAVGMGYLLYIASGHVSTLAESFAAGWQAATDESEDEKTA